MLSPTRRRAPAPCRTSRLLVLSLLSHVCASYDFGGGLLRAESPEFYAPTADDYYNTGYYGGYSFQEEGAGTTVAQSKAKPHKVLTIPGDIILGGLFPIHRQHREKVCGKIDSERGIHRLEAMLFTLDKINYNFSQLLPGIRLGALVMDTCGSDFIALDRSLEMLQTVASTNDGQRGRAYSMCLKSQQTAEEQKDIDKLGMGLMAGLVGSASSTESIKVASLFRLFRIPMISYASTSAELSDKVRYGYFARTVPSDIFQSQAVIDILIKFEWTYVSVVYSDGDYGPSLYEAFLKKTLETDICIAHVAKLGKHDDIEEYRAHVKALVDKDKAKVVVLFAEANDVRRFLKALSQEIPSESWPYFQLVASDGWGTQKALLSDADSSLASEGAITLEIKTFPLPGFDDYFNRLMRYPQLNRRNPWFPEFCEAIAEARHDSGRVMDNRNPCWSEDFTQDSKTIFVHNAVYAFALALRQIQRRHCGVRHVGMCDKMIQNLQAENVYRTILNITFIDPTQRVVKFDEKGDASGHYNIYKYQRETYSLPTTAAYGTAYSRFGSSMGAPRFVYRPVGEWNGRLDITAGHNIIAVINGTRVVSKCSEPCLIGQATRVVVKGCCWECDACRKHQYVDANTTQCVSCQQGWWPDNATRTTCYKLEELHLELLSWYVVPSAGIAFGGMLVSTITSVVYVKFVNTPLVKASSVELSFIILAGCFVTFLTTFFYLAWPSMPICITRRLSFGLGIATIYSAIAVKINRIYRIFEAATKSSQQPPMISPESQLILVACFVGVQLSLSVVSLLFDPPHVERFNPSGDLKNWYIVCKTSPQSYGLLMAVSIFLIVGATYYAIRTRNCPEPYREARVVGFSVYTTFIIWLAFVPLFFTTSSDVELQTTVICISLSMCGWVVLICLFSHRIYIIVFRPSKNVKAGKFTLSAAVNRNATIATKLVLSDNRETTGPSTSQYQMRPSRCSVTATSIVMSRNNFNNPQCEDDGYSLSTTAALSRVRDEVVSPVSLPADQGVIASLAAAVSDTARLPVRSRLESAPLPFITATSPLSTPEVAPVLALKSPSEVPLTSPETVNPSSPNLEPAIKKPAIFALAATSQKSLPDASIAGTDNDVIILRNRHAVSSSLQDYPRLWSLDTSQPSPDMTVTTGNVTKRSLDHVVDTESTGSSEMIEELRIDSTSSYTVIKNDCFRDAMQSPGEQRRLHPSQPTYDSMTTTDNPITAKLNFRSLVAPVASISSVNSYNLPTSVSERDRSPAPSCFSTDSEHPQPTDKTVMSAAMAQHRTRISDSTASTVVPTRYQSFSSQTRSGVVPVEDESTTTDNRLPVAQKAPSSMASSRDDIASILERHEQLTSMMSEVVGDRVISISDEVIHL